MFRDTHRLLEVGQKVKPLLNYRGFCFGGTVDNGPFFILKNKKTLQIIKANMEDISNDTIQPCNNIIMIGHLYGDPNFKIINRTFELCKFTIKVITLVIDEYEGVLEEVCFINVQMWGNLAQEYAHRLNHNSRVCVSGKLKYNNFIDQQTNDEITFHCIQAESITLL